MMKEKEQREFTIDFLEWFYTTDEQLIGKDYGEIYDCYIKSIIDNFNCEVDKINT